MAVTLESTTLKDIASAVADELSLDSADQLSVAQVTATVTYEVVKPDWLDEWYDEYARRHDEVPF